MKIKPSTLRLLIREAVEQIFEAETQYKIGDRVEIDSSSYGGLGTIEMARHPFYAIKFDQTGTTDSFHFSDLRPFSDEEEDAKNADIDTGLDEGEEGMDFKGWWSDLESWAKTNKYPTLKKQLLYLASIAKNYGIDLDVKSWEDVFKQFNAYLKRQTFGDWDTEKSWIENKIKQKLSLNESQFNPPDVVSLDVPLFIRMLEYSREDAKTDMDLHDVAEKAVALSITGRTLNMGDYDSIVSKESMNEAQIDKIYHVTGVLIVDDQKRNQKDILSDIRALPGITVVRNIEMDQDATSRYFRSTLEIKIDPYPYAKQGKFDDGTIQVVINNIKNISGVIGFKQTENVTTTND
jgi:hypothetical protein